MSWAGDIDPQEIVKIGQEITAAVQKLPIGDHGMELSLKALLPDPWDEFVRHYQVGDVIQGVVKSLRPNGVFVKILSGIDGWIPLEHLTEWDVKKPEDVVWKGDDVEAVIIRIDSGRRNVDLSIKKRRQQLARAEKIWSEIEPLLESEDTQRLDKTIEQWPLRPASANSTGAIMIIDDHEDIAMPLAELLRKQGYTATGVTSIIEAKTYLAQQECGVLLADIALSNDEDGLDFIAQMKPTLNNTVISVMSTPEQLAARTEEIMSLEIAEVFSKPLDIAEIERFL